MRSCVSNSKPSPSPGVVDMQEVFDAQLDTALRWRSSTARERCQRLLTLRRELCQKRSEFLEAFRKDLGKPAVEVDTSEFLPILAEIRDALRHLRAWMKPRSVMPTLLTLGTSSRIRHEPRGRSLIIAPWNFPLNLTLGPLVSALAAGCPAILKPSELTPHVSAVIAKLISRTFDPREVAVFEGDAQVAAGLLALPFDHIFFTGSTQVGSVVMAAAARNLATVTLELGGKSPTIVDPSCDLEQAAKAIVWGKFTNCGQACVAPDHVYVHESVKSAFVAQIKTAIDAFYGATMAQQLAGNNLGRIVSDRHLERLATLITDATESGASVLHGGRLDRSTRFLEPTVIDVSGVDCRLMSEEVFGPVLPVLEYTDLTEVVGAINKQPKPLALYLWSRSREATNHVLTNTSSGGVCVNHCMVQFVHANLPFGGVTTSGHGRTHGFFGFEAFSHAKPVLVNRWMTASLFFPPYTALRRRAVAFMMRYFGAASNS